MILRAMLRISTAITMLITLLLWPLKVINVPFLSFFGLVRVIFVDVWKLEWLRLCYLSQSCSDGVQWLIYRIYYNMGRGFKPDG